MKEREPGFYWVKLDGRWIVAEYEGGYNEWTLTGSEHVYEDDYFDEIDERRINRDNI